MGVQGLYGYVMEKKDVFQEMKVQDTKLIIDGSGILYYLAFKSSVDLQHGGDYDALADKIREFFKALSVCSIKPFVLLDGGKDYSKLNTVKKRAQRKIEEAHNMSIGKEQEILPLLSREVFKEVLSDLNVPFVQCIAEADRVIASLANEWDCPVLTSDSDFFIFDLKKGFLPTDHFLWNRVTQYSKYIPAEVYSADRFCAHFSMKKEFLPLFATMCGNDWVEPEALAAFFAGVKFPENSGHQKINGLLQWLAKFTGLEEALKEIERITKNEANIRNILDFGISQYKVSRRNVAPFFEKGTLLSNTPKCIRDLQKWIRMDLAKGELSALLIDALVLGKVMHGVQVENESDPSSHDVSLSIRKVLYGLLLYEREARQRQQGVSPGDNYCVEEFGRKGQTLTSKSIIVVRPEQSLQSLIKASGEDRLRFLLDTLGVERSVLEGVPCQMRLPVCVTCYWMSNCRPKPKHLQALLLGMAYGYTAQHDEATREKMVEQQASMRIGWEARGPNRMATHLYNQWQSCMRSSFHLNQLLRRPLPKPTCSQLYSGTLVHRLVRRLRKKRALEKLLQEFPSLVVLFSDLQEAVLHSVKAGEGTRGLQQSTRVSANPVQTSNRYSGLNSNEWN